MYFVVDPASAPGLFPQGRGCQAHVTIYIIVWCKACKLQKCNGQERYRNRRQSIPYFFTL